MTDREKVIKGLECIAQQNGTCGGCAYFRPLRDDPDCGWCEKVAIANDALALLRGQDKTANDPPFQRHDCGALIVYRGRDVCPNCGRKGKWDV